MASWRPLFDAVVARCPIIGHQGGGVVFLIGMLCLITVLGQLLHATDPNGCNLGLGLQKPICAELAARTSSSPSSPPLGKEAPPLAPYPPTPPAPTPPPEMWWQHQLPLSYERTAAWWQLLAGFLLCIVLPALAVGYRHYRHRSDHRVDPLATAPSSDAGVYLSTSHTSCAGAVFAAAGQGGVSPPKLVLPAGSGRRGTRMMEMSIAIEGGVSPGRRVLP
jgi:hypothetical protein